MTQYLCVNCFSCRVYQVVTLTKTRSFKCRICGEHQSLRKVFLQSSKAREVRVMVQKLNAARDDSTEEDDPEPEDVSFRTEPQPDWSKYLTPKKTSITPNKDTQPKTGEWKTLKDDIDELEFDESP